MYGAPDEAAVIIPRYHVSLELVNGRKLCTHLATELAPSQPDQEEDADNSTENSTQHHLEEASLG